MRSFLLTGPKRLKVHKSWAIIKIFKCSISEKMAIGTAIRAIRANKMIKMLFLKPFGGQKSEMFDGICLKSFCKIMLPTAARSTFLKNVIRKVSWSMKIMKEGSCSLHF